MSTENNLQAAQDIKNFAGRLRAMLDLGDYLERCGSLEQIEKEVQGRIDALRTEELKQRDLQAVANAAAVDAQAKLDDIGKQADAVLSVANATAANILADAHATADAVKKAGDDVASEVAATIVTAREVLASLNDDLIAARGALDEINAKTDAARAAVKAMFEAPAAEAGGAS